jgi:hypothetical protein
MATEDKVIGDFCDWATTLLGVPVLRSHQMTAAPVTGQYLTVETLTLTRYDAELMGEAGETEAWSSRLTHELDINAYRRATTEGQVPAGEYPSLLLQTLIDNMRYADFECFAYQSSGQIRSLKESIHTAWETRAQVEMTFGSFTVADLTYPTIDALDNPVFNPVCP